MGPRDRRSPGNFYPRPPRGGRHTAAFSMTTMSRFLSTPSARRATKLPKLSSDWIKISIHALREEGDPACSARSSAGYHFYPRPPRGGRPRFTTQWDWTRRFLSTPSARRATASSSALVRLTLFLSTPSARRATEVLVENYSLRYISIHALREEGDRNYMSCTRPLVNFYPRPPRGGRPSQCNTSWNAMHISIHALREEGDYGCTLPEDLEKISIHALREEGDPIFSTRLS